MKKWQCIVCGYVYDEAAGDPEHGIKAGTRWDDIPADWSCLVRRGERRFRNGAARRLVR